MTDGKLSDAEILNLNLGTIAREFMYQLAATEQTIERAKNSSDNELADCYVVLTRQLKDIEENIKPYLAIKAKLEEEVLPGLLQEEDEFGGLAGHRSIKSAKYGYTLFVRTDQYVSMKDSEAAINYLKGAGYEDAIKETVHHQTLRAIYEELQTNNAEVPEDIFSVYRKTRASVRKA